MKQLATLTTFVRSQHIILGASYGMLIVILDVLTGLSVPVAIFFGLVAALLVIVFCALERRNATELIWQCAQDAAAEIVQKKVAEANALCLKQNIELRAAYKKMLDQAIASERGKQPDNEEDMG